MRLDTGTGQVTKVSEIGGRQHRCCNATPTAQHKVGGLGPDNLLCPTSLNRLWSKPIIELKLDPAEPAQWQCYAMDEDSLRCAQHPPQGDRLG